MFISGSQVRRVLAQENRKETAWILGIGTPLPFFLVLVLGLLSILPIEPLVGEAGQRTSALLVLSIAVAVTSIPVISRIFYDLQILHTRFASLILGAVEDILLAVLATALRWPTRQHWRSSAPPDYVPRWRDGRLCSHTLFLTPHLLEGPPVPERISQGVSAGLRHPRSVSATVVAPS